MSITLRGLELLHFMDKLAVDETTGCVVWLAATQSRGYGVFMVDRRLCLAHRIAYETFVGPIPDGLQLDHTCRNRRCVNTDHLEPVTAKVNIRRGRGTQATDEHCAHGHPWTPETERYTKDGWRVCRSCASARAKARAA